MIAPGAAYAKWISNIGSLLATTGPVPGNLTSTFNMVAAGKLTGTKRSSTKGNGDAIQAILRNCDQAEQFERDVAMWYGYSLTDSKGWKMCKRLFGAMKTCGITYRRQDGTWGDFRTDFGNDVPVASLLSHGGRILFLLPMSNSAARAVGNTVFTAVKGITYDPVAALVDRGSYHTMRGKSTAGAVLTHGALRLTGLASLAAILNTPHKAYAAGDDRYWSYLTDNDMHSRGMATHSTIQTEWVGTGNRPGAPSINHNRFLWFTEEKASGGMHGLSNVRDAMMGRHYYKNVGLGGVGNINPFSGVKVTTDGSHGHLYANYRAPQYKKFGCILLGVEGSAPGMENQFGKAHTAAATKGEFSATGGRKWGTLFPNSFNESDDKDDVTVFVCDLSDLPTSASIARISGPPFDANNLSDPVNSVGHADWAQVVARI